MNLKIHVVLHFSIILIGKCTSKPHNSTMDTATPSTSTGLDCLYYCDLFFCEKGYIKKVVNPNEKCGCQYGLVQCPTINCPSGQYLATNNENICECPEKCEPCPESCSPLEYYCEDYMKINNTCGCTECSLYPCFDCIG